MFPYEEGVSPSNIIHMNRVEDTDVFNVQILNPEGHFIQGVGQTTLSKMKKAGYPTERSIDEVVKKSRRIEANQSFGFDYLEECTRQEQLAVKRAQGDKYREVRVKDFYDKLNEEQLEELREMLLEENCGVSV